MSKVLYGSSMPINNK